MKNVYLWLSGFFAAPALGNLIRLLLKWRVDINFHRVPLKFSAIIIVVGLVLAVVFYILGKGKK